MRTPSYFAISTILILAACGNDQNPTAPSGQSSIVTGLTITGPSTIAPGQTATFKATVRMSDGTTTDVSAQTDWQTTDSSLLSISSRGEATGLAPGEPGVRAVYPGRTAVMNIIVVPAGTYRVAGRVLEFSLPVSDASVEVIAGTGTGLSAATNAGGGYALYGVAGDVKIRVGKKGYQTATESLFVASQRSLDVAITQESNIIAGEYAFIFTADSSCTSLPADARQRRYTATISQAGPLFSVTFRDAVFVVSSRGIGNGFNGRIEPGRGSFYALEYDYWPEHDVIEALDDERRWFLDGEGTMARLDTGLVGTFNGSVIVSDGQGGNRASCDSTRHQFVLTRR